MTSKPRSPYETEEPTIEFRFYIGVLQQRWKIMEYRDDIEGRPYLRLFGYEWRNVPVVIAERDGDAPHD